MKDVIGKWQSGIDAAIKKYKSMVPFPVHNDWCQHGRNNFIEHIHGCDIHKYWPAHPFGPFTEENAQYCVRYSSNDSDYISSVDSLDNARKWAKTQSKLNLSEFGQLITD